VCSGGGVGAVDREAPKASKTRERKTDKHTGHVGQFRQPLKTPGHLKVEKGSKNKKKNKEDERIFLLVFLF